MFRTWNGVLSVVTVPAPNGLSGRSLHGTPDSPRATRSLCLHTPFLLSSATQGEALHVSK